MGLYVQSLESLPSDGERDYYIYLLDYGWTEPIGEALMKNYDHMAELAEKSNAVVIRSRNRVHFEDQVLSWHNVNGEKPEEMLPGILITNRNPHRFKDNRYSSSGTSEKVEDDLKLILIPLRKFCSGPADVTILIDRLFKDIQAGKKLSEFKISRYVKKGGRALADAMILEPAKGKDSITMDQVVDFLQTFKDKPAGVAFTTHRIHFEDFGGQQFERLVFAYVSRQGEWDKVEWLGETGGDGGRDVWGEKEGKTYCYQCANYKQTSLKKIIDDIDKLKKNKTIPDDFTAVCSGAVSAEMRGKIVAYAESAGIKNAQVWSGVEFEERLRKDTPDLVRRFVEGEAFPDDPRSLLQTAKAIAIYNVIDTLRALGECIDRPAFTTPFRNESNIPGFEKAISDTIEVLNTGLHRTRDGVLIRRLPSRHQINDPHIKKELGSLTQLVVRLRDTFTQLKKEKEIRPCPCDQEDCPTWLFTDKASDKMDHLRREILQKFRNIHPAFTVEFQSEIS